MKVEKNGTTIEKKFKRKAGHLNDVQNNKQKEKNKNEYKAWFTQSDEN